uniref:Uncharacterized protein n=1 Tax=Palpitomonas bilix TaxID=652834 RepID=A0A7S3GCA5_9EUKA|mmetsp:Transcript_42102/g.108354  ORF Transcript_42102/g.108354 Transcript_42102/m.108354 type:complete len:161 (+) Transcript_42102:276-758(+)
MENGLLNALKRLLGCFPCIPSSGAQPDVPDHRSTPSLSAPGQENSKIILDAESDEEEDDGEAWGSWETQGKGEAREGTAMQSGAGKSPKDELSATSISREQAEEELKATMASFNLNKTNTTPRSTDSSPKKTKASSGDGPVNEECEAFRCFIPFWWTTSQ